MGHRDIFSSLGLFTRPAKRRAVRAITYNRDGSIADVTMYCGFCKRHYVYEGGENIPDACPGCNRDTKWRVGIRYL